MAKLAHKDTPKDKLDELKAKHFTAKGRKQRIAKALKILNRPSTTFKLDRDTVKWIAQDVEIENLSSCRRSESKIFQLALTCS